MSKIMIRRPVSVVAIMTEKFREEMIRESEKTLKRLDEDFKKIEAEGVKYISSIALHNPQQASAVTQQIDSEKQRLKETRDQLEQRLGEIETIENGKEVPFQTLDGIGEIAIGDNLFNMMNKAVVVIKDWVVQEIREV